MVIRILDLVSSADTTQQGTKVLALLRPAFKADAGITLSFDGISTATSSFVNAAIVPLLDTIAPGELKARLRIVRSTRQINEMVKLCVERRAAAILSIA